MHNFIILNLIALVLSMPAYAQTYNGEFTRLRDQQQKAIQTATEPINRQYATALDQLLRKATQAGDLNTAIQIKEELSRLPVSSGPPGTMQSSVTPLLTSALIGKWQCHTEDKWNDTQEFKSDGTVAQFLSKKHGTWRIQGQTLVVTVAGDSQRYPLPLDPKSNKGITGSNRGIRMNKVE